MQELEPKFVDAFVEAARDTFETMAMMDLEVVSVESSVDLPSAYEVLTTIGLSGEQEGLLAVGLQSKFATEFVSAMLGAEPDELSQEEIADGTGELANMVAGGAKASLANAGWKFDLALPVVLGGTESVRFAASAGAMVRAKVEDSEVSIFLWVKG